MGESPSPVHSRSQILAHSQQGLALVGEAGHDVAGRNPCPEILSVPTVGQSTAFKLEESLQTNSSQLAHFTDSDTRAQEAGSGQGPASLRRQNHPWSLGLEPTYTQHCSRHWGQRLCHRASAGMTRATGGKELGGLGWVAREVVMSPEHPKLSQSKPRVVSHVSALCQELRSVASTSLTHSLPLCHRPATAGHCLYSCPLLLPKSCHLIRHHHAEHSPLAPCCPWGGDHSLHGPDRPAAALSRISCSSSSLPLPALSLRATFAQAIPLLGLANAYSASASSLLIPPREPLFPAKSRFC